MLLLKLIIDTGVCTCLNLWIKIVNVRFTVQTTDYIFTEKHIGCFTSFVC